MGASLGLIDEIGVEAVYDHVQAYNDRLEAGLLERGFTSLRASWVGGRSGILSVRAPYDHDGGQLAHGLNTRGIACTSPDGLIRFAPHWPNALDEIPEVLEALDATMKSIDG